MMEMIYTIIDTLLPIEALSFTFMKNAFLAILLLTPLLGLLGTMAVNQQMAFFSDALGHSALTGIGLGIVLGVSSDLLAMLVFGVVWALLISRIKQTGAASTDTVISVFSSTSIAAGLLILSRGGEYICGNTPSVVTEENIRKAFGVDAIIGEVETPENILQNVIPLTISSGHSVAEDRNRRSIATITIIANSNQMADKINGLLHEYGALMIGRMGMPYREFGLYLITITLDGSREAILELSHRLNILPDVSVKTTFAKGTFDEADKKEV